MLSYEFNRAWGEPVASGFIRQKPEDFRVVETLSFTPSGSGDHVYLLLEKTGQNTDWVASQLAGLCELELVDIGYAGLKDRHAVTQQWFSLHMPNQTEPDWSGLPDSVRLLSKTRHEKKLKTGAIKQNDFNLLIRELSGDREHLEERLTLIKTLGVPNYFGSQRFGRNNANVQRFISSKGNRKRLKRQQRGMLISAARSYLFNHILSKRVALQTWNQLIDGDVLMIDGSRSIFVPEEKDTDIQARMATLKVHPSAVLWGAGRALITGESADLAKDILDVNPLITTALDNIGASLAHRAMRINVKELKWKITEDDQLQITFSLISGAYATSVLSEFLSIKTNE